MKQSQSDMRILSRLRFPTTEEIELYALEVLDAPDDPLAKKVVKYVRNLRRVCCFVGILHAFIFGCFLADLIRLAIHKHDLWWMLPADFVMSVCTGWMFYLVFRVEQKFRRVGL